MSGVERLRERKLSPSYILEDRNRATLGLLGHEIFGDRPYSMHASISRFMEADLKTTVFININ
jgi:hypothetical protein